MRKCSLEGEGLAQDHVPWKGAAKIGQLCLAVHKACPPTLPFIVSQSHRVQGESHGGKSSMLEIKP